MTTRKAPDICPDFDVENHQVDGESKVMTYDDEGYWVRRIVKTLDLNEIKFESWQAGRESRALEMLERTGQTRPVICIGDKDEDGKYGLEDGNHRCFAAHKLGYTSIPAVVDEKVYEPPYSVRDMRRLRVSSKLFSWRLKFKFEVGITSLKKISETESTFRVYGMREGTNDDNLVIIVTNPDVQKDEKEVPDILLSCPILGISGLPEDEFWTTILEKWKTPVYNPINEEEQSDSD